MTFSDRILVPVANEDDAERTCRAISDSFGADTDPPTVIVVHVIEKGGGTVDKAPLAAREQQAEDIFRIAESQLRDSGLDVETELRYGTGVIDEIVGAVNDSAASSILFLPRPQGRLSRLLTGDMSRKLLVKSPAPVITLPHTVVRNYFQHEQAEWVFHGLTLVLDSNMAVQNYERPYQPPGDDE